MRRSAIKDDKGPESADGFQVYFLVAAPDDEATTGKKVGTLLAQQDRYLVKRFSRLRFYYFREVRILVHRHETTATRVVVDSARIPESISFRFVAESWSDSH